MVSIIISPPSPEPAPTLAVRPSEKLVVPIAPAHQLDPWVIPASEQRWVDAFLVMLQGEPGTAFGMWDLVNSFVAEACGDTRSDVRRLTRECLTELGFIIALGWVRRYHGRWIMLYEEGVVEPRRFSLPLKEIFLARM